MDFAQQQRNPAKHLVGIAFVVIFHILLVYALVNGLAQRVVDAVKKPVEVKIVEEVKPPPPPPQNLPPPPKLAAPPPPFIPPPEVPISAPPPVVAITQTPPPAPQNYQQQVAAPTQAAPAPAGPKNVRAGCSNVNAVQAAAEYPAAAIKKGISEATVRVNFTLKANGEIADVHVQSSNRMFDNVAASMVSQLKCAPSGSDQPFAWQIDFKLSD